MSFLLDVAVPELAISSLTYENSEKLECGARVIVSVGKNLRTGFVIGNSKKILPPEIKIKPIEGIINDNFNSISDFDIFDLALWAGKVSLCSAGTALKAFLPSPLITGEKVEPPPKLNEPEQNFNERNYFNPFDSERVNFYIEELNENKRTLILFPRKDDAKNFYDSLPENLKTKSLLWPSTGGKKLWLSWNLINAKKFRFVIGSQGAIFAPLKPQKIIIEDEANSSYIFHRTPEISARSLAGHRTVFLKAELILAGRMPSLKTFLRSKPVEKIFPERKNIVLADIYTSVKTQEKGIKGSIPLTFSLLKRTKRELINGNSVIWILDRLGESAEIFCDNCGQSIHCEKCGNVMRSEGNGNILFCKVCGSLKKLPEKCPYCGYKFLSGKRPGIEALEKIAKRFFKSFNVNVYNKTPLSFHDISPSQRRQYNKNLPSLLREEEPLAVKRSGGLIISTKRALELLNNKKINPSLIAWLDLDFELNNLEYETRFKVFNMLMESYWKGREFNPERKVLIQARHSGMKLGEFLLRGWSRFIPDELKERQEFLLPPYGFIVEIECNDKIIREKIIEVFTASGVFVMDSGEINMPLTININSLEVIAKILSKDFVKRNLIKIKVRSD